MKKEYLPLSVASELAIFKEIKSQKYWNIFTKTEDFPKNIRKSPQDYPDWESWGHFLATGNISNKIKSNIWRDFWEARDFCRKLGLKSYLDWKKFVKGGSFPKDIPVAPFKIKEYKDNWKGWQDWLNSNNPGPKSYKSFEEAREYVRSLGLKSFKEFSEFSKHKKLPIDIPASPMTVYEEYVDVGDWLGTGRISDNKRSEAWRDFIDARDFVREMDLKSTGQYREACKNGSVPNNIPACPDKVYPEFTSYGDWLGSGIIAPQITHYHRLCILKELLDSDALIDLPPVVLLLLAGQNNSQALLKKVTGIGIDTLLSTKEGSDERKNLIEKIQISLDSLTSSEIEILEKEHNENCQDSLDLPEVDLNLKNIEEKDEEFKLPEKVFKKTLSDLQKLEKITISEDSEIFNFIVKYYLDKLWRLVMTGCYTLESINNLEDTSVIKPIKKSFYQEYYEVEKLQNIPLPGYIFKGSPNLMQWVCVNRIKNSKRHGNWSEAGAGKTLASVLATVICESELTLFVCPNSRLSETVLDIHSYFSGCTVYTLKDLWDITDNKLFQKLNTKNCLIEKKAKTFLVVNVESFQSPNSENFWRGFSKKNEIDFIILDEVQDLKQTEPESESKRKRLVQTLISEQSKKKEKISKDLYVLPMSGTAVVNNLDEAKHLIEMFIGEKYSHLGTKPSIQNALKLHQVLNSLGTRFCPILPNKLETEEIYIDGSELIYDIASIGKGQVLTLENCLIDKKLQAILPHLRKGEKYLFYTHFVEGILEKISGFLSANGFSFDFYTGEYKNGKNRFINGEIDVLIGSSSIAVGIDGLQNVCNNLIVIVPPWTNSGMTQLIRRIYRQGSKFKTIFVKILYVEVSNGETTWSWDKKRYDIIDYKKTLGDCVLDGIVPEAKIPTKQKLLEKARKGLADMIERIETGKEISSQREKIEREFCSVHNIKKDQGNFSKNKFRDLNRDWSNTKSPNLHSQLQKDPSKWHEYHSLYREKRKSWSEIPYEFIASLILKRPDWVVGDFGCGDNLLKKYLKNPKFFSFDHVSIEDDVIACDISKVPLEDEILDVAVYSLSLMGSNFKDYLIEAKRVLKPYGKIFIAEPNNSKKWGEDIFLGIKKSLEESGFSSVIKMKQNEKFIYIQAEKN